ncbi:hypothetical protein EUX98_g5501 [Antrodiella citrinella]|uniref:laccase n=1 Tax=Antrodiella citrinella TaxID=2447956 RepID=A0A4S4MRE7_9APHY|nr:hypothetical protein EUX98_g5501 [Antrodiella citrinella]
MFFVYDPQDPQAHLYDVNDESTVITLADWYHTLARQGPRFPTPDPMLINGKGRFKLGVAQDLSIITVEVGKRYRFQLVNIACDPAYTFSIDSHDVTIIKVDGVNSQPHTIDSFDIFAGQRYSIVVNANQPVGNYWIRANPNLGVGLGFEGGINSAVLRYVGAPNADPPVIEEKAGRHLKEPDLHPIENPGAPGPPFVGGVDHALNLLFKFKGASGTFTIDNHSFESPSVPVLLQILSGAQASKDLLPEGTVFPLPGNSTIECPRWPSPFPFTWRFNSSRVVSIGASGDNVTIRFKIDNPGPWFLHWHIDWHLEAGFAVVFAEDVPNVATFNSVPQAWKDLCPKYDALDPIDH